MMTFGVGLSYVLFALAPSWHFILIGAVLMALCNSTYQPALGAMIADSLPPERRGMGFGIVTLIGSASTTPGPALAAFLYTQYGLILGMRIGYGIVVGLFLAASFLRLFRLKETVTCGQKPSISEFLGSYPTAMKESFQVWKKMPKSLLYLFFSLVIMQFGFATVTLYLSVYAVNELLIEKATWGVITAVVPITTILLAIPVGKTVDKTNRKVPILLSYLLFGVSMLIFMNANLAWLFVSLAIVGVGQVMMNTGFSALQADLTPKEERGKVNGFTNFAGCIFMAVGNLVGGVLYDHVSPQWPFIIAMVSIIPSFLLTLFFVHEAQKREE